MTAISDTHYGWCDRTRCAGGAHHVDSPGGQVRAHLYRLDRSPVGEVYVVFEPHFSIPISAFRGLTRFVDQLTKPTRVGVSS